MVAKQYYHHGGTGLGRVLVEFGLRLIRVKISLPWNFRNNRFVAKMRKIAALPHTLDHFRHTKPEINDDSDRTNNTRMH